MCRMPASTKASYVGRFAPPGYPNTTSTPSALRHSMMASTARIIIRAFLLLRPAETKPSLSPRDGRFRGYRDLGELELGPAVRAHGVVQLDDLPAARALAPQLVAVVAVGDRRDQPEEGQDRGDHEPQEERRPFHLADE